MTTPSMNQPLNPAQNQLIIALAASVSDSVRTSVILLILAAARLGQREDAPKQLAGMNCKQIFAWIEKTQHGCSYEAVRKLLKSLVETDLVEFCRGKYTLADAVVVTLRKLDDSHANMAVLVPTGVVATSAPRGSDNPPNQSGNFLPNSVPSGAMATPTSTTDTASDEVNKKAIDHLVDIVALRSIYPRSSLYWQVACCHTGSLAHLAAAASGLATELMSGTFFVSPIGELQGILDGKSAIKPTSAASFVFAYEASNREAAAEANKKFLQPYVDAAMEILANRFAPRQEQEKAPVNSGSAGVSPLLQPEDDRPLATIYQLHFSGDYGNAA